MRDVEVLLVCQQHDPDIWHEEATEGQAIDLCLTGHDGGPCPVLAACLNTSTDPANQAWTGHGVWGGVGHHTRDRIRARRGRGEPPRYPIVTFTATNRRTPVQELSS